MPRTTSSMEPSSPEMAAYTTSASGNRNQWNSSGRVLLIWQMITLHCWSKRGQRNDKPSRGLRGTMSSDDLKRKTLNKSPDRKGRKPNPQCSLG
ncbi:hypothetical protein TURU_018625 [Turdus rufiventris]|nr:hypothetical protein TURU_018625 [Turdus rufiventris]